MPDSELEKMEQLAAAAQQPPRKQIVYPAGPAEVAVLEGAEAGVPPGVTMLAFRFDAPWEAVLVPMQREAVAKLREQLPATPGIIPAANGSHTAAGAAGSSPRSGA